MIADLRRGGEHVGGGTETIQPEALRKLAEALEKDVAPSLEKAKAAFEDADIGIDAFSDVGRPAGYLYPGTREFAMQNADRGGKELAEVNDKLTKTADIWDTAETDSTVSAGGGGGGGGGTGW